LAPFVLLSLALFVDLNFPGRGGENAGLERFEAVGAIAVQEIGEIVVVFAANDGTSQLVFNAFNLHEVP